MSQNVFDSGAWYLLAYTNTLSYDEWRATAKQSFCDLEAKHGIASAKDNLAKMIAYYCMEVAPGASGRKAMSHFRKVHTWGDFRDADTWWLDEWKARRRFDGEVTKVRARCATIPSIPPTEIQNEFHGRAALDVIMSEARRRYEWEKQRYSEDNFSTMDACARVTISMFGGSAIIALADAGKLRDKSIIPNFQTSYWLERALVSEFGEHLIGAKQKEMDNAT